MMTYLNYYKQTDIMLDGFIGLDTYPYNPVEDKDAGFEEILVFICYLTHPLVTYWQEYQLIVV